MIMSLKQREVKIKPRIKLNHNIYMQVCTAITNNLAKRFIHLPEGTTQETPFKSLKNKGIPGILGAIDCTHILIQAPWKIQNST